MDHHSTGGTISLDNAKNSAECHLNHWKHKAKMYAESTHSFLTKGLPVLQKSMVHPWLGPTKELMDISPASNHRISEPN